LIKTSLKSKMVLTTVFSKNKKDFTMLSRLKSMAIWLSSILFVFALIRAALEDILTSRRFQDKYMGKLLQLFVYDHVT
jgi:hypothetical protein